VRSDEDPEQVRRIAQYVNDAFRKIMEHTEGISQKKTATLAAFHIASEYFQLLRERKNMVDELQRRSRQLNSQIDAVVE
jgi:cell division protein ZapA (FtsZ GTPase activity inhibitor)